MIYWKIGEIGMNVLDPAPESAGRTRTPDAVLRAKPGGVGLRGVCLRCPQSAGNGVRRLRQPDQRGQRRRLSRRERTHHLHRGRDRIPAGASSWQFGKFTDPNNNRYNPWIAEGMFKVRFDGQAAYIVPPIAEYKAGPSGFAWNPGTALDEQWRRHFFVTSFTGSAASARVFAFQLTPKGAGYELGRDVEILRGVLSPGMRSVRTARCTSPTGCAAGDRAATDVSGSSTRQPGRRIPSARK